MKKVLVTGGAGFIGSHTVLDLIAHKYRPVIVDNFSNSHPSVISTLKKITDTPLTIYSGDLQDKAFLKSVFDKEEIDGIIHFAAFKSVPQSIEQPLKYYSNNVGGLLNLLNVAIEAGSPPLVFSSSCTIYGDNNFKPIKESTPFGQALSPYAVSKQICERALADQAFCSSFKARSLRYFNVIGASPDKGLGENLNTPTTNILKSAMHSAVSGQAFNVFGKGHPTRDGTPVRDYIHVSDVARAHVLTLKQLVQLKSKGWDVYNIGTGKSVTVLEMIQIFEKVSNLNVKLTIGNSPPGYAAMAVADSSKIKKELGWKPQKNLEQAVADSWRWYQMNEAI